MVPVSNMHLQKLYFKNTYIFDGLLGIGIRYCVPEEKPSKVDIFDFVEHCVEGDNVTDVVGDQVE